MNWTKFYTDEVTLAHIMALPDYVTAIDLSPVQVKMLADKGSVALWNDSLGRIGERYVGAVAEMRGVVIYEIPQSTIDAVCAGEKLSPAQQKRLDRGEQVVVWDMFNGLRTD